MPETRTCPKCGAVLPADAPAGICPKCLMQAGLASEQDAGSAPQMNPLTSGFVPPEPEDLAKHFPQLEILELLGKGGMGAVYKARQPGLDRLVAVKILPPEISRDPKFAERFQREARALARLSHPHIVAVYDFGVVAQASLCYIVMEFVDGANLRQTIKTGKLRASEALAIVPQICEALQFAHDEGIVHRDIKPENILIDKRGRVKIADFGLAKLLGQDADDPSLTATHQVMGTLRYMAPEQMQGSREVDHRADIYSLGVIFYELLTGELPMGRFAPPSKKVQVDVRLDEIVLRALEQQPEQRYQNASEIKTDVEHVRNRPAGTPAISGSVSESPAITSENGPAGASHVEAVTAVAVSIAFVLAAVNGVLELAQIQSPLNALAVFVTGLATTATAALLVVNQIRPPSRSREELPVFCLALLSTCAGSLPWTTALVPTTGWRFWEGAQYAALSFALSLRLLFVGSSRAGTRAIATILVGMIGFGHVMWFHVGPACLINGPLISEKSDLPGMFLAAVLSVLATIAGALQLRKRTSANHNAERRTTVEPASPSPGTPLSRTEARSQESLPYLLVWLMYWLVGERWFLALLQTASAIVYAGCLIAFFSFQISYSHAADGPLTTFEVGRPAAWLTLEDSESGQHVRFAFITLTHVVALTGLASLAVYRWLERRYFGKAHSMKWHYVIWFVFLVSATAFGMKVLADSAHRRQALMTSSSQFQSLPPLGTITGGIGAEFTVPAGQVATFEIVTRRNSETVSVLPHCGYVMAPPDSPISGTFRWSPKSGDVIANGGRQWSLEIVTSGGGGGYTEATLLPIELNDSVGAMSLGLGVLEPNEETIHWAINDVRDLPDNGQIGLRVTVVAHGMKSGGSGNGHIDWQKAQSAQSTTRRKLPGVAP